MHSSFYFLSQKLKQMTVCFVCVRSGICAGELRLGGKDGLKVRAGEWEKGPCWLLCSRWAESSDLGQMGWFLGVLILTSPNPQASLPGPLPLLYLLDAVQNGIRQPSLRFTFSQTLCAARVAQQILKPEEHVYIKVKEIPLSHRYLDLRKVPGFLQLFYSFDFEKTEREWILRFLGEGLRDKHCYELYVYQRIFRVILSFFSSPFWDQGSQSHILEILQSAARVTRAAHELIEDDSLLSWVLHGLEKRTYCTGSGTVMDLSCLEHYFSTPCLSLTKNLFCKHKVP
ncbi:nucleolar pre-ribosomal-associated protein 1-like isoform X2 [Vidua chalybeata]|uniref:nucleolar pre-ribosomal-associated protein 1-like isoform X2 n=1 Tax=Vidua chalybeata TaxID=81927 RepID=UPI0023A8A05F|nr:nucleolar pre-ribosomal-associated protein 1-like isoform X2 [Vidua chalybeata]XP_053789716.1 nucleolar pre-ribosomal-associated protein 1-like isoform X2 [Vidua chalybeata]